jgi:hypothetical protein|tara:strand:- start:164 stop:883 length:720 start_codon:yes stop_codon:yes gene_type:complete
MSIIIHTIESTNKDAFNAEVNIFLELGIAFKERSYAETKEDDSINYSQSVLIPTKKYDVWFNDGSHHLESLVTKVDDNGIGRVINWYDGGKIKSDKTLRLFGRDGSIIFYPPRHGKCTEWWYNGQKWKEGTYRNDQAMGKYTEWWLNGQKAIEGTLKYGKYNGEIINWYENGQKKSEETFIMGKRHGKHTRWFENGQVWIEGTCMRGQPYGKLIFYYYGGGVKEVTEWGPKPFEDGDVF